jgi:hypothetical protein
MAMCRPIPTGRPRTPWPRLCDEGLPSRSLRRRYLAQAVPTDEASGDHDSLVARRRWPPGPRVLRLAEARCTRAL